MSSAEKVRVIDKDRLSIISRMSEQVASIPKKDVVEVKSLHSPPVCVKDVLTAVLIIMGKDNPDWRTCRAFLADMSALKKFTEYRPESLTQERRKKAVALLSKYSVESVMKVSMAVRTLFEWAVAVVED